MDQQEQVVPYYMGLALDQTNQKLLVACFRQTHAEAESATVQRLPGMPFLVVEMSSGAKRIRLAILDWLIRLGLSEAEAMELATRKLAGALAKMLESA